MAEKVPLPPPPTPGGLTSDADLGRPFGRAIQHALLDCLHLLCVRGLGHSKDLLNEFEDLGLVALPDLHAVFEHHDDVLRPVLSPVLRALLRCPCGSAQPALSRERASLQPAPRLPLQSSLGSCHGHFKPWGFVRINPQTGASYLFSESPASPRPRPFSELTLTLPNPFFSRGMGTSY